MSNNSKAWSHYYYSLAVSGCCTALVLVIDDHFYIASAGDCRAVMGFSEHNSDNINELNRIYSQHAPEEKNFIIRENRLLGQLMPLRAFGDFSFKWSIDKMKQLGLTKAFGSHVIPSFYLMRITEFWIDLLFSYRWTMGAIESPRKVIKTVNRYRQNWFELIEAYSSAKLLELDQMLSDRLTLDEIMDRLRDRIQSCGVDTVALTILPVPVSALAFQQDYLHIEINCIKASGSFSIRTRLSSSLSDREESENNEEMLMEDRFFLSNLNNKISLKLFSSQFLRIFIKTLLRAETSIGIRFS
ncbi:[Pyruvate dehydrogenase [acetyl-transferring]]-phosphatase 2 [Sarcoptes scabiei]|uniref:[Pyruvate dehydrogenase [acetyl-transferring]]-phosphatase 2, mitochondrial n=1 Tax=Sarcoptes scabiei TaxID=52283 RepID=A0A834RFB0_SARSC|nr:[Pyruvate dehydrogenase [acetyl-transferring]]-phosphatase 2 [Sarcoptes scabiei]